MNVIHIISSLSKINYGISNAALFASSWLEVNKNVNTAIWVCEQPNDTLAEKISFPITYLDIDLSSSQIRGMASQQNLTVENTIFVSHGCWLRPTRIAFQLQRIGYRWLYVPHGMLEPWSQQQGQLKKSLYYFFVEGKLNRSSNAVRAVSENEKNNLTVKLKRPVTLVENGVQVPSLNEKTLDEEIYLFMARLHHKKGIVPLVKAWNNVMAGESAKKLLIAGPDEGELKYIKPLLGKNVHYLGAVYGTEKTELLKKGHYFLLPSYSEGFPTSVLEAMSFGLIPLISGGCNFGEVFSHNLGYRTEPDADSLESVLHTLKNKMYDRSRSFRNHDFVRRYYSEESIGEKLFNLYSSIMEVNHKADVATP